MKRTALLLALCLVAALLGSCALFNYGVVNEVSCTGKQGVDLQEVTQSPR